MNYYPYGDGGTMQPSDKVGMPGIYGSPIGSMAYAQQGPSAAAMQPSAQHYTSIGSAQAYPAGSVYASSIPGSSPYGSVSVNPYARPSAITSAHVPSAPGVAVPAYAGYSASPYASQAVSPTFRSPMVAPSSRYPSSSYSVGNGSVLGYPAGATPLRSPAAYQAIGAYPTAIPAYQSAPGLQGYATQLHPVYASLPTYPGTSPYVMSRQLP